MAKKKAKKLSKKRLNNAVVKPEEKTGKKRKVSFKAYCMGASIVLGFAAFFTQYTALCIVAICLFLVTAYLMGKEHFVFLIIGGLMALLLAGLNKVSILYMIPLVWSLFYLVLMFSGMFMMKKNK